MRVPQVPPLAGMTPLGLSGGKSKTLAQRRADASLKPAKPQEPCDVGLFGDDSKQMDLAQKWTPESARRRVGGTFGT